MIELFCRKSENIWLPDDSVITPLPVFDDLSLSAVMLNDSYYQLFEQGKVHVEGCSVLKIEYLILFKMYAWIDLKERAERGEPIDSRSVKEHKNDIFRLSAAVSASDPFSIGSEVLQDVDRFMKEIVLDPPDLKNLGV